MLPPPLHKGKNIILLKIPRSRQFYTLFKQKKPIQTSPSSLQTIDPPAPSLPPYSTTSHSISYCNYQMKTHRYHKNHYPPSRNSTSISDTFSKRQNITNSYYESLSIHRKKYYKSLPKIQEQIISKKSLKKTHIELKLPKQKEFKKQKRKSTIKMASIQQIVERLQKKYNPQKLEQQKQNEVVKIKIKPKPKPSKSFLNLEVKLGELKKKERKSIFSSFIEEEKKQINIAEGFDIDGWTKDNKSQQVLNQSKQNFF